MPDPWIIPNPVFTGFFPHIIPMIKFILIGRYNSAGSRVAVLPLPIPPLSKPPKMKKQVRLKPVILATWEAEIGRITV
jgi:hypothetical protein